MKIKIKNEIADVLNANCYEYTNAALEKIVNTAWEAKTPLREMLRKHPNWDEEQQAIVFDRDYERVFDPDKFEKVQNWMGRNFSETLILKGTYPYTKSEVYNILCSYKNILDSFNYYAKITEVYPYRRKDIPELIEEHDRYKEMYNELCVEENAIVELRNFLFNHLGKHIGGKENYSNLLDEDDVKFFTHWAEKCKINVSPVVGQRITKVIRKFLLAAKADQWPEYNTYIAMLGDAINPIKYSRHTAISIHPVDFLYMSNGDNWESCHDIRRNYDDESAGCYSSGTLSYMLDPSSVVFYTVDSRYEGNELRFEPKTSRQMFYLSTEKDNPLFIQSRLYPQSNDTCSGGLYQQIRELMENIVAQCLEVPNYWSVSKSVDNLDLILSYGTHYKDYMYNTYPCKMIKLKDHKEFKKIVIGHKPICPDCGNEHTTEENISCCEANRHECYECGTISHEDNMHYIDGDWYCEDCCFYCEYHEEWETNSNGKSYVEDFGYVCDYALESTSNFIYCEHCGAYSYYNNAIIATDGTGFCCESCAEREDYIYVDGEWIREEEDVA